MGGEQTSVQDLLAENEVLYSKIGSSINCSHVEVPAALREVLRFMHLIAHNKTGKLTPSIIVDLVWHEFILCTQAYQEYCDAKIGRMIHHHPGGSEAENQKQFKRTIQLYTETFGAPDKFYWGGESDPACGACESV